MPVYIYCSIIVDSFCSHSTFVCPKKSVYFYTFVTLKHPKVAPFKDLFFCFLHIPRGVICVLRAVPIDTRCHLTSLLFAICCRLGIFWPSIFGFGLILLLYSTYVRFSENPFMSQKYYMYFLLCPDWYLNVFKENFIRVLF